MTETKASKRSCTDLYDNEKKQGLDGRYVPLSLRSQKESNRPIDLGKGTKSPNYFI